MTLTSYIDLSSQLKAEAFGNLLELKCYCASRAIYKFTKMHYTDSNEFGDSESVWHSTCSDYDTMFRSGLSKLTSADRFSQLQSPQSTSIYLGNFQILVTTSLKNAVWTGLQT